MLTIENRAGVDVLVMGNGCRPATEAEIAFHAEITRLRAEVEALRAEPVEWRDHVEQRLHNWRQRFVNRSGDRLALDDMMSKESIDDLIDYVCDEWSDPVAPQQAEPVAWMAFGGSIVHAVTRNAMDPIEAERFDVPLYLHPPAAEVQRLRDALENVRLLAARHRKEEWAGHMLRFCADAGVTGSPLREGGK